MAWGLRFGEVERELSDGSAASGYSILYRPRPPDEEEEEVLTAAEIIERLDLKPHPEGGFYHQYYRADEELAAAALPARYGAPRALSTAIYYLLTADTFSEMHRLASDEIFHHYAGDAVEQLQLFADGSGRVMRLGMDLAAGERPQLVVLEGVWQGSRLAAGGEHGWALLGTTVAPGFDFADYRAGGRAELSAGWPAYRELIAALTRLA